jgi:hypothetical protein
MAEINIMPKKANKSERKFKIGDIVFLLRGAHDPKRDEGGSIEQKSRGYGSVDVER